MASNLHTKFSADAEAKSRYVGSENDMAGEYFIHYFWDSKIASISDPLGLA